MSLSLLFLLMLSASVVTAWRTVWLGRSYRFSKLSFVRPLKHTTSWTGLQGRRQTLLSAAASDSSTVIDGKNLISGLEEKLQKCLQAVELNFASVRSVNGAHPSLVDKLKVKIDGAVRALNQCARISTSQGQTLVIEPFDRAHLSDIERAILASDLNMTPQSDGTSLKILVPPLTEERRKALSKQVKTMMEEGKVAMRNVRRDFIDKVRAAEKAKSIGKDECKGIQDKLEKLSDKFSKSLDTMLAAKDKEIMKV